MAYLVLFIVVILITYVCTLIYSSIDKWIKKNISNPFVGDVIRVIVVIVLLPIPFIFIALGYILGYSSFNKE